MANGVGPSTAATDTHALGGPLQDTRPAPPPPAMAAQKKGRQKKAAEGNDTSKLVAQKIAELELNQAGEKGENEELGRCTTLLVFFLGSPNYARLSLLHHLVEEDVELNAGGFMPAWLRSLSKRLLGL